jgi:hypothetical protein
MYNSNLYCNRPLHQIMARIINQEMSSRIARHRLRFDPTSSCGICGGQSSTSTVALQVLWFLLPVLIQQTAPHSLTILSWTPYNIVIDDVVKYINEKPKEETGVNTI